MMFLSYNWRIKYMKSTDIKEVLTKLYTDKYNYKSILIDGIWGCGKTHHVLQFLKEKYKNVFYISLFGLESIDELNSNLYAQIHQKRNIIGKASKFIIKAAGAIPYMNNASEALSYQLSNSDVKIRKKEKMMIILDDLERLSKKINYDDLLGYINRLFLIKAKIVVLCSSNNIPEDRKNELNIFKEKVFDACMVINEFDSTVYEELFEDLNVDDFTNIINLCDSNIRTAQKCKHLLENINEYLNKNAIKLGNCSFTRYDLLISSLLTICIFWYSGPHKIKQEYNSDISEFGEQIANGIDYYFNNKEGIPSRYLKYKELTKSILRIYMYDDFDYFNLILNPNNDEHINIFSTQFFYLSDENKKRYFEELENAELSDKKLSDINSLILNIVNNSNYEFNEKFIKKIAQLYCREKKIIPISKECLFSEIFFKQSEIDNQNRKSYANCFVNKLYDEIRQISWNNETNAIITSYNNRKYGMICDILEKHIYSSKEELERLYKIIKDNVIFPNLSGNITPTEWTLAHRIAELMEKLGKEDEFFKYAKQECKKEPENNSLIERYIAIFKYRFNKTVVKDDLVK